MFTSFLSMGASDVVDEAFEQEFKSIPLIECHDDPLDACMRIAYESTVNFNNITKALAMDELKYFQENGVEYVYEAAKFGDIFQKIKDWLQNAWSKVMGVIKKVIEEFDNLSAYAWYKANMTKLRDIKSNVTLKDEVTVYDFIKKDDIESSINIKCQMHATNKYGITITNLFSYESAKGELSKVVSKYGDGSDNAATAVNSFKEKIYSKGFKNELYHVLLGGQVKEDMDYEKFSKACISLFRGDSKTIKEVSTSDIANYIKTIKDSSEAKSDVKKVYNGQNKIFKDHLKKIDNAIKSAKKMESDETVDSNVIGVMHVGASYIKDTITINNAILRAHLSSIRMEVAQAKKVLQAVVDAKYGKQKGDKDKKEEKTVGESASFLDSLELI